MGHLHRVGGATPITRPLRAPVGWAITCSFVFAIVYSGCNWLTGLRSDVGQWSFQWEQNIPFVPWMIVPYWSIDLLFVGSFFLCRTSQELRAHVRRILLTIVLAGLFFLLFPLQIVFPRPEVSGMWGVMFGVLRSFDQPYNLFPSLHIAFWFTLRQLYARHTRGAIHWLVNIWFVLVAVSTLLTWQHQVIDVLGGAALAVFCFYLVRENPRPSPVTPNWRIGGYYLAGAAVCSLASAVVWPWFGFLIWPMISLLIVAGGYFGLGPGIYRKEDGRLPLSAKLVLAPVLLGQRASLWYYGRQCRAWDEVVPGVIIGRVLSDAEAEKMNATAILDLTAEFSEARPFLSRNYRSIPVLDLTEPTWQQLEQAAQFIGEHATAGRVYVHCKIGYSRSAAVVGAYLLASGQASDHERVIAYLRKVRPSIVIRAEAARALAGFALRMKTT